jgi:hypothetical protein
LEEDHVMPKIAWAETTTDWEELLRAAEPYGDVKGLKVHLAELRAALSGVQELQALRLELKARRQRATQEMEETREAGKIVAIQIRSLLRGILGHTNERLVQFKVRPRRRKDPQTPAPSDPSLARRGS